MTDGTLGIRKHTTAVCAWWLCLASHLSVSFKVSYIPLEFEVKCLQLVLNQNRDLDRCGI